ncbi:hypothetical protein GMO_06100 [Gluconobacter morbifer G707]|uniref:Uncharacterized protein n=1 Tax=Gluconobacter morbifer G707 TaxID=1088869 RepID=G6XGJ5_9PROT|nr:hypothetical protein GMO_06100 [Gluconobacter morbifer G707]
MGSAWNVRWGELPSRSGVRCRNESCSGFFGGPFAGDESRAEKIRAGTGYSG